MHWLLSLHSKITNKFGFKFKFSFLRRLLMWHCSVYAAKHSAAAPFCAAVCTAIMLPFWMTYCRTRSPVSEIRLNTRCEVHRLAFHTCLFPRLPVLQFVLRFPVPRFRPCIFDGPAFSTLASSVPPLVGLWCFAKSVKRKCTATYKIY